MKLRLRGRRLHCAYLRARAALHRIAQSFGDARITVASKRAVVTMVPTPAENLDDVWSIQCAPQTGCVLPAFTGTLWVQYRRGGGANLRMIAECGHVGRISASKICTGLLQELGARIERHAAAT